MEFIIVPNMLYVDDDLVPPNYSLKLDSEHELLGLFI